MRKTVFIAFFFLFGHLGWAQKPGSIRPFVAQISDSLAQIGMLELTEGEFKNPVAKQLLDSASIEELSVLTRHPHPAVRAQAWAGLLQKKEVSGEWMLQIAREHWQDMDTVQVRCYQNYFHHDVKIQVGDFFLRNLREGNYAGAVGMYFRKDFRPDPISQRRIDSFLICDPPPFPEIRFSVFWNEKPRADCYTCVRRQVEEGRSQEAVIYLAKFRKEQDVELIINHLPTEKTPNSWARLQWMPLLEFQHPRFFQVLKDSFQNHVRDANYLRSVRKYANRDAAILFDSIFYRACREPNNGSVVSTLGGALFHEFDTVFADVYVKILSFSPENTYCRIPDNLWSCRPDTLAALYEIWKNGGRSTKARASAMFPKYQEWLSKQGAEKSVALVMEQIRPGGVYRDSYKAFSVILNSPGKSYFVEPLFALLEKEPLAENRFFLAKLLLEMNLPEVKSRLEGLFSEKIALRPTLRDAEKGGSTFSDFLHFVKNEKK